VPDYTIDGVLFLRRHYEGGFILRELILLEAFADAGAPGGWRVKYGYQENNPGQAGMTAATRALPDGAGLGFAIPLAQKTRPGFRGTLRFEARPWD
jgi:hypothetical protein